MRSEAEGKRKGERRRRARLKYSAVTHDPAEKTRHQAARCSYIWRHELGMRVAGRIGAAHMVNRPGDQFAQYCLVDIAESLEIEA